MNVMFSCKQKFMKVSAIIPTYNRAAFIERAISSIFNQTYKDIEIIVVDDGSTDNTIEILNKYRDRIKIIRQKNMGTSEAKNTGINNATGEIVMFLDSDDEWLPTKAEKQVEIMTHCRCDVACCLTNTILDNGGKNITSFAASKLFPRFERGIWMNPSEVLTSRFFTFTQAVAVWKTTLDKIGGFNPRLSILEDFEFAFRLSLAGNWAYINEPLVVWHDDSPGSLSDQATANNEKFFRILSNVFFGLMHNHDTDLALHVKMDLAYNIRKSGLYEAYYRSVNRKKKIERFYLSCRVKLNIIHEAVRRRLPWFPKMKVKKV
jgi:glycosyltransferase involved in cell wall biosynthesis